MNYRLTSRNGKKHYCRQNKTQSFIGYYSISRLLACRWVDQSKNLGRNSKILKAFQLMR